MARRKPELSRLRRSGRAADPEGLFAEYDVEYRIGPDQIYRRDSGSACGNRHVMTVHSQRNINIHRRVDDDVDGQCMSRYRGSGLPDVGVQTSGFIDVYHDESRRNILADHRTDSLRPVARGRELIEERPQQGEASPPEEVG
jgi:hypothetical protein